MFGYRYTPDGTVFPLPDLGLVDAAEEVTVRRVRQMSHSGHSTIELVTDDGEGEGWQVALLPDVESTPPQQADLLPAADDDGDAEVRRVLAEIARLPKRSGRSRRRR